MRQVVLDTETTGLSPEDGHRIIEIGCVELLNRQLTGNHYHVYINPDRQIELEAVKVHGITNQFLADKPRFAEVVDEFMDYINGAELIIHNAPFDVGFINHELKLVRGRWRSVEDYCTVFDTLTYARKKFPGQRNSLDRLCKRYDVDNSHRELHGALLDSEILADVFLMMTSGQTSLGLGMTESASAGSTTEEVQAKPLSKKARKVIYANDEELATHNAFLKGVDKSW